MQETCNTLQPQCREITDSRAGGLFQRLLILANSALVERKFEFNYVLHKQIQNSKAVVITLHLLYTAPLHAIMQARATSAQRLACSGRCTLTKAPFEKERWTGLCTQRIRVACSPRLFMASFDSLHYSIRHSSMPHTPKHLALAAMSELNRDRRKNGRTRYKRSTVSSPEVARNVVPVDLNLDLSLEGNDYKKSMLSVQATLSQPELALGTTQNQGPLLVFTVALKQRTFHTVTGNITEPVLR